MSPTAAPAAPESAQLPAEIILNGAVELEYWLRSYPDWKAELESGPDSSAAGGGGSGYAGQPTAAAVIRLTTIEPKAVAIAAALPQIPEPLREVVELYYFQGIHVRRRRRNAALAHLLNVKEIRALLTK